MEQEPDRIGFDAGVFVGYAARTTTLREHRPGIEKRLGLRGFEWADVRSMLTVSAEIAASTDLVETIVAGIVDRLRVGRIALPAASTLNGWR